MIIEGFELSSRGNAAVIIANDERTEKFTVLTHKNLPVTHNYKHLPLWKMTDDTKQRIENEIKDYIRQNGDERQYWIVFGTTYKTNGNK